MPWGTPDSISFNASDQRIHSAPTERYVRHSGHWGPKDHVLHQQEGPSGDLPESSATNATRERREKQATEEEEEEERLELHYPGLVACDQAHSMLNFTFTMTTDLDHTEVPDTGAVSR